MIRLDAAPVETVLTVPVPEEQLDVFSRNLRFMVSQVAGKQASPTLQMLQCTFPDLKDFDRLRLFARLYVDGGLKPLQLRPLPSMVEPQNLKRELAQRVYGGMLVLGPEERIVYRGAEAFGPFDTIKAISVSRQLSAESPTNDSQGHVLDPEQCDPPVVGIYPELA